VHCAALNRHSGKRCPKCCKKPGIAIYNEKLRASLQKALFFLTEEVASPKRNLLFLSTQHKIKKLLFSCISDTYS